MRKKLLMYTIFLPYGIMMSGPIAVRGAIISFVIGIIAGGIIF